MPFMQKNYSGWKALRFRFMSGLRLGNQSVVRTAGATNRTPRTQRSQNLLIPVKESSDYRAQDHGLNNIGNIVFLPYFCFQQCQGGVYGLLPGPEELEMLLPAETYSTVICTKNLFYLRNSAKCSWRFGGCRAEESVAFRV